MQTAEIFYGCRMGANPSGNKFQILVFDVRRIKERKRRMSEITAVWKKNETE